MLKSPVIVKGYLINLSIFDVWVYKKLSKFPVTIEGIFKIFNATPHQILIEIHITIEESKIFFQKGYTNAYVTFQYY